MNLRTRLVALTVCVLLTGSASTWALAPHDRAPGVHAHKVDFGKGQSGEEQEGTEFWPTFLGYRLKVSDTIVALSTAVTAIFTGMLWRSTEKLWLAGKEQMSLTQAAMHGTETPYLVAIVRRFDPKNDPAPPGGGEGLMSYTLRNCGRSPAIVLEVYHSLGATNRIPRPTHFPPLQTNLFRTAVIAPGEENEPWRFTMGSVQDWTPADQVIPACLSGSVRYADVFGNQFVSNFCYLRNGWSGNWYAAGTAAHNTRRLLSGDELAIA